MDLVVFDLIKLLFFLCKIGTFIERTTPFQFIFFITYVGGDTESSSESIVIKLFSPTMDVMNTFSVPRW